MILKCKMCGGNLNITAGQTICKCEYCGTIQTYPKVNDENISRLISRADSYRREFLYDNAIELYNRILDEEKEDPEIYWLIVLNQYGIEYVDDVRTHKKVPTINRTSRSSIFSNENYKKAIELADYSQREVYEAEAIKIDNIQKQILEISSKEEPYDIFICYKETDEYDKRTEDSVIAYDLYNRLVNKGYKVFYSKISLSDKTGNTFEPYIYSALNTSKVMILIGTSAVNISSPWVKNEWSRFITLMKQNSQKHLIPCFKNIRTSDLPDDISFYQGINMSDLGWEQDLEIAICKFIGKDDKNTVEEKKDNIRRLLDRAELHLRNNEYDEAYRQFDRVLDFDIKNLDAYIGKLCSEYKVYKIDDLKNYVGTISGSKNYQWLLKNGDENIIQKLTLINELTERNEKENNQKKTKRIIIIAAASILLLAIGIFAFGKIKNKSNYSSVVESDLGDVVNFGSYEQDNSTINGKEQIQWIVIEKSDKEVKMISRYVIDCQSYSNINSYVQYDNSYIKQWLNESFYPDAFDNDEKSVIKEVRLLTTDEAKSLFADVSARSCVASKYSISKGLEISSTYGNCEYWLIPSNELSHYAAKVNANGSINSKVDNVNIGNGVRPVIIIKLK